MTVKDHILDLFGEYRELTIKEIIDKIPISKQWAHVIINQLLRAKEIERIGHPPKTVYRLIPHLQKARQPQNMSWAEADLDKFLIVTETGQLLEGEPAFLHWCRQRSLPPEEAICQYGRVQQQYARYHDNHGIVDGFEKFSVIMGFESIWLDELCFLDFDTVGQFGKTRLGTLINHAKHGQNKELMNYLMDVVSIRVIDFLEREQPEAIGFVPPVIRREAQFMNYFRSRLNIPLPLLDIRKISGITAVPQNSFRTVGDRSRNADTNFSVASHNNYHKVVLIDDMVDSGATLNQIAFKLKNKHIANDVTGLAIVGNLDGFTPVAEE
jgi:phosphoribosylpyrophosphate synthetase